MGKSQYIYSFWNAQCNLSGTYKHTKFKVTWITFLPHSDAEFELDQVVLTMTTSLNWIAMIVTFNLSCFAFSLAITIQFSSIVFIHTASNYNKSQQHVDIQKSKTANDAL